MISHQNKIKVLLVTTSFPVIHNLGSGIFVKKLADSLSDRLPIEVVCPATSRNEGRASKYPIHYVKYAPKSLQNLFHGPGGLPVALKSRWYNYLFLMLFCCILFIRIVQLGKRVDLIHANWSLSGVVSGLAARIISRPVLTTLRGADLSSVKESLFARIFLKLVVLLSTKVIVVSEDMELTLRENWPHQKDKFMTIYNGVAESFLKIPIARNYNDTFVLTVGSLIPRKNTRLIIEAMEGLQGQGYLDVVGEGYLRGELERLVEDKQLSERVCFHGAVSPDDIVPYYQRAKIFIIASYSEGRPNVVLEAMASGCVVIAMRIPPVELLIQDGINGFLFEKDDVAGLKIILTKLKDDPCLCEELGNRGRELVVSKGWTWSGCAEQYISSYQSMASRVC